MVQEKNVVQGKRFELLTREELEDMQGGSNGLVEFFKDIIVYGFGLLNKDEERND